MITGPRHTVKLARRLRSELTLPETLLWNELRKRPDGIKFRRQHPAGDYVLDFYCAKAKLAIEVDGRAHDNIAVALHDKNRAAFLKSRRIATTRIPAQRILDDVEPVVRRVVEICRSRIGTLNEPLHQTSFGPPPRSGEV